MVSLFFLLILFGTFAGQGAHAAATSNHILSCLHGAKTAVCASWLPSLPTPFRKLAKSAIDA